MASLKHALKRYAQLTILGGVAYYFYLDYSCRKRREDAMNWELTQAKKDTTRPSNVYYGINWGYRADETIEKSLDTGDLLFFSYECD